MKIKEPVFVLTEAELNEILVEAINYNKLLDTIKRLRSTDTEGNVILVDFKNKTVINKD